jgi:hypothetical protein
MNQGDRRKGLRRQHFMLSRAFAIFMMAQSYRIRVYDATRPGAVFIALVLQMLRMNGAPEQLW